MRTLARALKNIKVLTLCGGTPSRNQTASLEHGAHIVVGTPGRLQDHIEKQRLNLECVNTLVLDEADRMLEMGFQEELDRIVEAVPPQRQSLLFSATYPEGIQAIAKRVMNKPVMIQVEAMHDEATIKQHFHKVKDDAQRLTAVRLLILKYKPESTLVFCKTKQAVQTLTEALCDLGFSAMALHGDREQKDRDQTLIQFANKSTAILVATDVASRGLDIESIDRVINYDLAHSKEAHIHRMGRTGRAGSSGVVHTLYSNRESEKLAMLDLNVEQGVYNKPLPSESLLNKTAQKPMNVTIRIDSGKKQKIRAGDILGALTRNEGIEGKQVGKIQVFEKWSYVAVNREVAKLALKTLTEGKLKGRSCRAKFL